MNLRTAVLGAVLFAAAATAAAQQDRPADSSTGGQERPPTIVVPVNLVNLLFTVTDKKGKLISGLTKTDFKVYEDNVLQTVGAFSPEPDPPLAIAVLIDASGSIHDKLKFEQAAAADFFQYTLIRRKDKGVVISFDSGVDLLTPDFTDDPGTLREALLKVRAGGATSLFDAVYLAVKGEGPWKGLAGQVARRVIVIISDGADNGFSHVQIDEALKAVQASDVAVYAISTNSNFFLGAASSEPKGEANLRKLTDETGGQTFLPNTETELFSSFDRIRQDLRTFYTIGYRPINERMDGAFRKIRIELTDRHKDYRVRHRLGYYAQRALTIAADTEATSK